MDKKFRKFLLFWCLGFLIIGIILCAVLYKYLEVYEATRPEIVVENLIQQYLPEDWYTAARNNPTLPVNEFENPVSLYDSYLGNSKLDDGRISYFRESTSSSDSEATFGIRSGSTTIAKVTLSQDTSKPVGFGRCEWTVKSISMPDFLKHLSSKDVFVAVPDGEEVECNGKKISNSYLSSEKVEFVPNNRFETPGSVPDGYVIYNLGKMYGDISMSTSSGKDLIAGESNGRVVFGLSPENQHAVDISAPHDVTVYINDVEVDKSEGTADSSPFENLEEFTKGKGYDVVRYKISGFINKPDVEAKDSNGASLKPITITDGKYVFMHANDNETKESRQEYAKEYFKRYLTYALNSDVEYSALESVLRRCLVGSELFSYLEGAENALMWKRQSKVESSEIVFDNFSMISDDCFVCSVEYTINQVAENEYYKDSNETLHNAFQLVFVKKDGLWVCARMDPVA